MTRKELFELYKDVQNKDKSAEDKLIAEHKKHWPHHHPMNRSDTPHYREMLHMCYVHLDRKLK